MSRCPVLSLSTWRFLVVTGLAFYCCGPKSAEAQMPIVRQGEPVPRDVREMYDRGLQYLVKSQSESGSWPGDGMNGAGTTGLALMAFLASGEDPNFGLYSH